LGYGVSFYGDTINDRVGIGTAVPDQPLSIEGRISLKASGNTQGYLGANSTGDYISFTRNVYESGGAWTRTDVSKYAILNQLFSNTSGSEFQVYTSAPAANPVSNWTLRFLIKSDGNVGIGGVTSLAARAHIAGGGATSGTDALLIENSSGTDILVVQDDAKVGILTASPAVSLDMGSATDAARLPNGTTAQRPTATAGQIRYNSTVGGLEVRDGSKWIRLTSSLTPGIAAGAAAGTGPTISVTGNDLAGSISLTTGTSTTTGTLATVTFNQAFDGSAQITVQLDGSSDAAITQALRYGVGSAGNTSFVVTAPTALDASTSYVFTYTIHQ
jgi:hypothetical protein